MAHRLVAWAAIAYLAALWTTMYRRRRSFVLHDPLHGLALFTLATAFGDLPRAAGIFYGGLTFTATFGSRRRVVLVAACHSLAMLGAHLVLGTASNVHLLVGNVIGMTLVAGTMHLLGGAFERQERSMALAHELTRAATGLATATDERTVLELGAQAARSFAGDGARAVVCTRCDTAGVVKVRAGGEEPLADEECVSAGKVPPSARPDRMVVPLLSKGEPAGTLLLQAGRSLQEEVRAAVGALATVVSVSLERVRLDRDRDSLVEQQIEVEKLGAIGRLAGGIAHDFNNLLAVITSYTSLLLEDTQSASAREDLKEIDRAALRAATLTRQLLAFSRRQVLQPTVVDVNVVVGDMRKLLQRLLGEDIQFLATLDPGLGTVRADVGQLEQVVMNLAVNARDAMPYGGKLVIETRNVELAEATPSRPAGRWVQLAVTDTGSGMSDEVRERIFEPFFTTKEVGKGTGLGLATVYGIVTQSGGHIEVKSQLARGTTFTVALPRLETAEVAEVAERSSIAPGGTETVLLVEDEDALREASGRMLRRSGYAVLEARNGGEALLLCEQHRGKVDLLVTDVVMPLLSGFALAERLTMSWPKMRVLFVSGHPDESIAPHGQLRAGTILLRKPFSSADLAYTVRRAIDGTRTPPPAIRPVAPI
ncbi:MAG: response regulator [Deltaproteobacteria bacterium]|nr:response regulator [Deltaproteobacteria bacterium]